MNANSICLKVGFFRIDYDGFGLPLFRVGADVFSSPMSIQRPLESDFGSWVTFDALLRYTNTATPSIVEEMTGANYPSFTPNYLAPENVWLTVGPATVSSYGWMAATGKKAVSIESQTTGNMEVMYERIFEMDPVEIRHQFVSSSTVMTQKYYNYDAPGGPTTLESGASIAHPVMALGETLGASPVTWFLSWNTPGVSLRIGTGGFHPLYSDASKVERIHYAKPSRAFGRVLCTEGTSSSVKLWRNGRTLSVEDLVGSSQYAAYSSWELEEMNVKGQILASAIKDGTRRVLLLVPVEMKVVDRDDPAKTWTTGSVTSGPLAYTSPTIVDVPDVKNGDLISWTIPSLTGGSFQWWATGPSNSRKDAPSSVTGNEWKLEDPLDWLPGTWRIHCRYTPLGGVAVEFAFEQSLGYRSPDIIVIGWIDGAQIDLPSGSDKPLLRTWPSGTTPDWLSVETWMGSVSSRLSFLLQISAGDVYTIPITPDSVRKYMNAWLIKDSPNAAPPASFLEEWDGYPGRFMVDEDELTDFRDDLTKFRSFHRFQARFELDDSGKIKDSPHFIKNDTNVGVTPTDWLGWIPPDPRGETGLRDGEINTTGVARQFNPKNGKTHSAKLADDFEQYTQGRIASEGAFLSKKLNYLDVPWIWSIIEFGAAHAKAGTTAVPEHEIFQVYHIYYNGKRIDTHTNSISEAKIEEFIQLGEPIAP